MPPAASPFFCPPPGSEISRVSLSQPACTKREIPPHKWLSDALVLIGEDDQGAA